METTLPLSMTIKQVLDLWSSEPESLQIVDLRGMSRFETEHIPGALALSAEELRARLASSAGEKIFVLVCEHEEAAIAMIQQYRLKDVVVMREGMQGWRNQGLPVERKDAAV